MGVPLAKAPRARPHFAPKPAPAGSMGGIIRSLVYLCDFRAGVSRRRAFRVHIGQQGHVDERTQAVRQRSSLSCHCRRVAYPLDHTCGVTCHRPYRCGRCPASFNATTPDLRMLCMPTRSRSKPANGWPLPQARACARSLSMKGRMMWRRAARYPSRVINLCHVLWPADAPWVQRPGNKTAAGSCTGCSGNPHCIPFACSGSECNRW